MRILHFLAATAALVAAPVSAQNILTNGDFEASGDIGFGDHTYYDIPGWQSGGVWFDHFMAWNSANLVQVDGPGGGDYGDSGPESDADGGPAGTAMHYVDDSGGGSRLLLWQYFTPNCNGTVQGSAMFSNRGNNAVPIALGIVGPITNRLEATVRGEYQHERGAVLQAFNDFDAAFNAVAATSTIPGAPSRTYTWQFLDADATTVVSGQTYAFAARIHANGNIDNAAVEYIETQLCVSQADLAVQADQPRPTSPLPPMEQAEITKSCEAPRAGQVSGVNGYVWDCDISVVLNPAPFAGTFTLHENASQITNGTASFVSSSLPCAGIGTDMLQCVIDGATATSPQSMSVQLFASATNPNREIEWTNCVSGETSGSSNPIVTERSCVDTTIKPDDTPREPVIDVTKTCEPAGERQIMSPTLWFQPMRCALNVTTNGVPFTGPLWLTEELTYGLANANSSISALSSSDPWQCAQPPFMAPGQSQGSIPYCTIMGAQFPHTAGTSTVYVDFMLYGAPATLNGATNCVGVTLGDMPVTTLADVQVSDCTVIIPAPVSSEPELLIAKTCEPAVQGATGAWNVQCAVTITGSNLPSGEMVQLGDEITSSAIQSVWQGGLTPPNAWGLNCGGYGIPGGIGGACDVPTDLITAQGGSVTIPYSADFTGQAGRPLGSPQAQNCTFADLTNPSLHAPSGPVDRVCVPIVFNLSVTGNPNLPDIAVPDGPTGPIITDGGSIGSVGGPFFPAPVDPSGPAVIDGGSIGIVGVPVFPIPVDPTGTGSPAEPSLSVTKTCEPLVFSGNSQTARAMCSITVTGSGLTSANTVHLTDQLIYASGGSPQVPFAGPFMTMLGASNWACANYPNGWSAGTCTTSGDVIDAAGGTVTFVWSAEIGPIGPDERLRNCVSVYLDTPINLSSADCAPIAIVRENAITTGLPTLVATPNQIGRCRADRERQVYDCAVGVTLENTGTRPFEGPIALLETFGAPGLNEAELISGGGVQCGGPVENAVSCAFPSVTLPPRDVFRVDLSLVVPGRREGGQMQVCASLGAPENSRQRVAMVQNILNHRGFDAGPVDGLPGSRTYAALAQLQTELGLPQSREFDARLMAALGLAQTTEPACTQLSLPPMPAPPLQCNRATTITRGESCVCRYDGMVQRNATSCACPSGTELVRGEGCQRVSTPAPAPTPAPVQDPASECPSGLTLNGACVQIGRPLIESITPRLQLGD